MTKLTVQIEVDLTDVPLDRLTQQLACDDAGLAEKLATHGRAALREYIDMFTGEASLSRASDIREHRLMLIISQAYRGRIPTEAWVSRAFRLTAAQGRSLLRSTLARFRQTLGSALAASVSELLPKCRKDEENRRYTVEIPDASFVEALNEALYEEWFKDTDNDFLPRLTMIDKSTATYAIPARSFDALKARFVKP